MQKKSRAQEIVDQIRGSERYKNTRSFEDRVYGDEPILRTGAQAFTKRERAHTVRQDATKRDAENRRTTQVRSIQYEGSRVHVPLSQPSLFTRSVALEPQEEPLPETVAQAFRKMRAVARLRTGDEKHNTLVGSHLLYEQGKLMEDFTDDYDGTCEIHLYYPTYNRMTDRQLRCYFTWRTRLRASKMPSVPEASLTFLFLHAYELLCGIGVTPGQEGYEALRAFAEAYADASPAFNIHLERWIHDYVVFYDLDPKLVPPSQTESFTDAIVVAQTAQKVLLTQTGNITWPERPLAGLPEPKKLLDALCALSRYRAERSRFFRDYREDVALVVARVFARMVEHCHKRRKTDYLDGMFGNPMRQQYTMFAGAMFWSPTPHPDATCELQNHERYVCERGFWWRVLPCRRMQTNRDLGNLLHAIDTRMRLAYNDANPLKERKLPKYQAKIVDEEIAGLQAQRKAEEEARIHIDRSNLASIRSAAARTREALLTDEEREEVVDVYEAAPTPVHEEKPVAAEQNAPLAEVASEQGSDLNGLGLAPEHARLLMQLLDGSTPTGDDLFVSLAVDAINEAFLDVVGDIVVEFDGDAPALVEDYVDDVRDALS